MSLSGAEKQLIKFIRDLGWGEVAVRVENGKPVMIYEAIKTFKLEEHPTHIMATKNKHRGHLTVFK